MVDAENIIDENGVETLADGFGGLIYINHRNFESAEENIEELLVLVNQLPILENKKATLIKKIEELLENIKGVFL